MALMAKCRLNHPKPLVALMRRILSGGWVAAIAASSFFCSLAWAQIPGQQNPVAERSAPAGQYAIAFLSLVLIMVIICMPSRKRLRT
jgi:hypothetical protein